MIWSGIREERRSKGRMHTVLVARGDRVGTGGDDGGKGGGRRKPPTCTAFSSTRNVSGGGRK